LALNISLYWINEERIFSTWNVTPIGLLYIRIGTVYDAKKGVLKKAFKKKIII